MPKHSLCAVQIAVLLQTYAQMQLAEEQNVSILLDVKQKSAPRPKKEHISLDVAQKGTHRRSELQYYCRRMPKSSPLGGSLDPPEYSKISGLLQRLDSQDGMGRFGPIWASEAARAILGVLGEGQNVKITI